MASGVFDDALIKHLWSTDELRAVFSDRNRVQKWYDFEAALALEQAETTLAERLRAREAEGRLAAGVEDRPPAAYQDEVDRYFRSLAAGRD